MFFWHDQILLLTRATEQLEAEKVALEDEKVRFLGEKHPPPQLGGLNTEDLQVRIPYLEGDKT